MSDQIHIAAEKTIGPVPADNLPLKMVEEKALSMKELLLSQDKLNRELLEEKLARIDERYRLNTKYETQIRDLKFEARDKARELQAIVYESRLQNLNHENSRIVDILKTTIPREVHDRDISAIKDGLNLINVWIAKNESAMKTKVEAQSTSTEWVKWVLGLAVTLLLAYIAYTKTK